MAFWEDLQKGVGDFLGGIGKFFYNPEATKKQEEARKKQGEYLGAYDDLKKYLDDAAKNYPEFRATMQRLGYLNPDNTINYQKMMDSGYLELLKNRYDEMVQQIGKQAEQNVMLATARGGYTGDALTATSKAITDAQRKALADYAAKYLEEKERAKQSAWSVGSSLAGAEQGDYRAKTGYGTQARQAALQSAATKYQEAQADADAEQLGILQDPARLVQLGIGIAEIAGGAYTGNPAMAASGASTVAGAVGKKEKTTKAKQLGENNLYTNSFAAGKGYYELFK